MRSKILLRRIFIIGIPLGITFSVALLSYFFPKSSIQDGSALQIEHVDVPSSQEQASDESPAPLQIPKRASVELPVRLIIPNIKVDAPIEYVGLAPDGAMDVPKELANTAWFELGQRPGENGSAVIAGHYGWKNMERSVFDDLHTLRKGDKVYVEDDKGDILSFVVRDSRGYEPQADASAVFGSNDGKAHLNLVTCAGEWDQVSKTYSERLVVFTDRE